MSTFAVYHVLFECGLSIQYKIFLAKQGSCYKKKFLKFLLLTSVMVAPKFFCST